MPDGHEAHSVIPPQIALTFNRFAHMAERLATVVANPSGQIFSQFLNETFQLLLDLSGAAVASCRRVRFQQEVTLVDGEVWGNGFDPVGRVAQLKHPQECHPNATQVFGWNRTAEANSRVAVRKKPNSDTPYYSNEEITHFNWLKSEALIPLRVIDGNATAMIVLGHPELDFFNSNKIASLENCRGLLDALYELAVFAEDRVEKARLLERIAGVLPLIASAETELAFGRAVCTIMTCEFGFRFDRAMYFRLRDHALPADCMMAIGGKSDAHPRRREEVARSLHDAGITNLSDFTDFALRHPLPQKPDGTDCDELYLAACAADNPLVYRHGDSDQMDKFLETGGGSAGGSVLRLSHSDPWIAKSHASYDQLFFNRNDEFFTFLLQPIKPDAGTPPLGFVIADLPYQQWKHQSGPGFPDLEMASITLKLLAGLWEFRNDSRSYFHILGALPLLRHSGGRVLESVDWIRDQLMTLPPCQHLKEDLDELRHLACDVANAKKIVESLRSSGPDVAPFKLLPFLHTFRERAMKRHLGRLDVEIRCPDNFVARIDEDAMQEILTCLADNAVVHGGTDDHPIVNVVISVAKHVVPEYGRRGGSAPNVRLLVTFTNHGAPIPDTLSPFVFADRVSTHHNGFGSGLSSARLLAKAFGGDLVLLSPSPVSFGVVLEVPEIITGEEEA